jgi:hypothetical protein
MSIRGILARGAVVAGVTAAALGTAAPAFASEGDAVIQSGEFVVWRDCNFRGPIFDFASVHSDYYGIFYVNDVNYVDNSASGAANYSTVNSVNAFFNPGFTGPRLVLTPGQGANLCGSAFNGVPSTHVLIRTVRVDVAQT